MRRSRGYAPQPITLPLRAPMTPVIAVGARQKAAVCIADRGRAVLSQHVGDLDTAAAVDAHRRITDDLRRTTRVSPKCAARDAHPDYESSRLAAESGLPIVTVQHHAAHVYAAMAEHGIGPDAEVFGVAWDGAGYGADGAIWGGEFLRVRGPEVERVGRMRCFRLPGADAAVRQPRRSAIGALYELFGREVMQRPDLPPVRACAPEERALLASMLRSGVRCPLTTSAGRLFDAVASLLDLRQEATFEGEAAMQAQFAAEACADEPAPMTLRLHPGAPAVLDWGPALRSIIDLRRRDASVGACALGFHHALADGVARMIETTASDEATILITGGCFQNRLLAELTVARLEGQGMRPLLHEHVPPNDGGVALGQAYAAALALGRRAMEGEPCV